MKNYAYLLLITTSLLSCGEKNNDFSSPPPQAKKDSIATNKKDSDGDLILDKDDSRPYIVDIHRPYLTITNENNEILETIIKLKKTDLIKEIKTYLKDKNHHISHIHTEYLVKNSKNSEKLFFKSSDNSDFSLTLRNGDLNLFKLQSEHGYAQSSIIPHQLRKTDFKFTPNFLNINNSDLSERELLKRLNEKAIELLVVDFSNPISTVITKDYISNQINPKDFSTLRTINPIITEYEIFAEKNSIKRLNDMNEDEIVYFKFNTKDQKQIVIVKLKKKLILKNKTLYHDGKLSIAQSKEINLGNFTHLKLTFKPHILFKKSVKKSFTVSQHLKNAFDSSIRKKNCKVEQLELSNTLELISINDWLKYFSFFLNDKKVNYNELSSGIKLSDTKERRLRIRLTKPIKYSYKTGFIMRTKKCESNIPPALVDYFFKEKPLKLSPIKTIKTEVMDVLFNLKINGKSL